MTLSIVIRSKDEADRLRLTLASLARQSESAEIVVVDDGSRDHTGAVIDDAARTMPLIALRHETPRGRSAASNAGARMASGEIILFLDGDTLADPELVRRHAAAHHDRPDLVGRGETFHLRCTRFLLDPETGTPRPEETERWERMPAKERDGLRVTRTQILHAFETIANRAEPGIYPGAGPRLLQDIEIDALRHHPDCAALWAAAVGSNQSVPREAFLSVGGFNDAIDINEHRELALRLCKAGLRMGFVEEAGTYHMLHRSGWRDPLKDDRWERHFYEAHPTLAVKLLAVFWSSLSPHCPLAPDAKIRSIPELERAAAQGHEAFYDTVRAQLGLRPLRSSITGQSIAELPA
jgi:glycosyltransferase involved in cell wall biosynthesis